MPQLPLIKAFIAILVLALTSFCSHGSEPTAAPKKEKDFQAIVDYLKASKLVVVLDSHNNAYNEVIVEVCEEKWDICPYYTGTTKPTGKTRYNRAYLLFDSIKYRKRIVGHTMVLVCWDPSQNEYVNGSYFYWPTSSADTTRTNDPDQIALIKFGVQHLQRHLIMAAKIGEQKRYWPKFEVIPKFAPKDTLMLQEKTIFLLDEDVRNGFCAEDVEEVLFDYYVDVVPIGFSVLPEVILESKNDVLGLPRNEGYDLFRINDGYRIGWVGKNNVLPKNNNYNADPPRGIGKKEKVYLAIFGVNMIAGAIIAIIVNTEPK